MSTFRTPLKRRLWQGYTFFFCSPSLYFFPSSFLFTFYIHPRYTHTPLYFIRPSMLRKYLKNESIGRWLPDISFTIQHFFLKLNNRSTLIVRSKSHFSLSIIPHRRKNFHILFPFIYLHISFLSRIFLVASPFFCCGWIKALSAVHFRSNCKQTTRPYQPPGLIKSTFFLLANCEVFAYSLLRVFSHNLFVFFSNRASPRNLA